MATTIDSGLRDDLAAAHRTVIDAFGMPGPCWSAAERAAIGREVRRAFEHADRPPWDAPSQIDGLIDDDHPLPGAAVDAIWRITNHPGTTTREWYDQIVAGLPSAAHYVELVSLVAPLNAVDRLAGYLDLDPIPLPEPGVEPATGERVDAAVTTHWVPTTDFSGPNVGKALSGIPNGVQLWMAIGAAQYVAPEVLLADLDWSRGTLDRRQIELVAARTSQLNECFY